MATLLAALNLMPAPRPTRIPPSGDFAGKAWQQVLARDATADGTFVYAVRSTRVFCKPSCPSRRPTRRNVSFFTLPAEAEAAGFRACLRCRPNDIASTPDPLVTALAAATDYLQAHARHAASARVTLASLATAIAVDAATITRAFEHILGTTPAKYARSHRLNAFRESLQPSSRPAAPEPPSITDALYAAGFGSSSRLYESSNETLGMTPSTLRAGGAGATVFYTLATSPLGRTVVAATATGVCAIAFGDSDPQLRRDLEARFPKAIRREIHDPSAAISAPEASDNSGALEEDPEDRTARWLAEATRFVLAALSENPIARTFPLDVRATAFQTRIWQALQAIPRGETRSYAAVAQSLGQPTGARAVATACAANPVALAIPCHRVVGAKGALTGYRWGVARKRSLLEREAIPPAPLTR